MTPLILKYWEVDNLYKVKVMIRMDEELKLILKRLADKNKFSLQDQIVQLIEIGLLSTREEQLKKIQK